MQNVPHYVPVLSSEAGSCLTALNWQEVNIKTLSYYLDTLLLKPGLELLNKLNDVAGYLGWSGSLVLNASRLNTNKKGEFIINSPYDGSKLTFTYSELFQLIAHLKPAVCIVPANTLQDYPQVWEHWNHDIIPVISADSVLEASCPNSCGIYFNQECSMDILIGRLQKCSQKPLYVSGVFNPEEIALLIEHGVDYIETDQPAQAALNGQVYAPGTLIDLKDASNSMQFERIDPSCFCPCCSQGFTKAYLYHLYQHTPLLCQRFLIQHNVYQAQK